MKKIKRISIFVLAVLLLASFCQPVIASTGKININTTAQKELVKLKHVGNKIAVRIIEYRKEHPFEVPQDIMKVKGIGQKMFDANKDAIIVKDK